MYLASPQEIAEELNKSAGGRGDTVLREYHKWGPSAKAHGTVDKLPDKWKFTEERAKEMFDRYGIQIIQSLYKKCRKLAEGVIKL